MQKKINYKIGFADGEIIEYLRSNNQIVVKMKTWNDVKLTIIFQGAIGMVDYGAFNISNFVEEDSLTTFMEKVLLEFYDSLTSKHPYKLYQFLNLDDNPSLEIVAESLSISDKA